MQEHDVAVDAHVDAGVDVVEHRHELD